MSGNIAALYGGAAFDTQTGEGMDNFDPLPAGWYAAMVEAADVVQTKAGTGWYLKIKFYILDPRYNGRKIFRNITLRNPNTKAEEIGQRELTTFGQAIGLPVVNDSADCLNRQVMIKLKITHSDEYGDQNDVNGYKPVGVPAPQQPAAPPTYSPPAPAGYAPPPAPPAPAYAPPPQQQPPATAQAAAKMPWQRDIPF